MLHMGAVMEASRQGNIGSLSSELHCPYAGAGKLGLQDMFAQLFVPFSFHALMPLKLHPTLETVYDSYNLCMRAPASSHLKDFRACAVHQ